MKAGCGALVEGTAPSCGSERIAWGDLHGLYPNSGIDAHGHAERMGKHLRAYAACIRWCLDMGADFYPAFLHKHKAPYDPADFYYGVAPWLLDGSVNFAGVPPGMPDAGVLDSAYRIPDFTGCEDMFVSRKEPSKVAGGQSWAKTQGGKK